MGGKSLAYNEINKNLNYQKKPINVNGGRVEKRKKNERRRRKRKKVIKRK